MGPLWQHGGGAKTNNSFPCLLVFQKGSWLFLWGEGRGVPRSWVGGVAEVFVHPLGGGVCRAHAFVLTPALPPDFFFLSDS